MQIKSQIKRFAVLHGRGAAKSARVQAAVPGCLTPVSKADICAFYPDISPSTVETVLGRMAKAGRSRRTGKG